jgi:predicted GIY-YIG superfamily endonuclease
MSVALYRFYGDDDRLLYIGISSQTATRIGQHVGDKDWFQYVARATFEHYPTREVAAAAEKRAIKAEQPLYNLAHVPDHILRPGEMEFEDTATYLRVDAETLLRWVNAGRVPCRKRKNLAPVFEKSKLEAWMRSLRRQPEVVVA